MNRMNINGKLILLVSFLFLVFYPINSEAATLYLSPEANEFGVGQEFSVDVYIDTDEEYINAGQAVINFPSNVLELQGVDRNGSVFKFWVEDPSISKEDGTLSFIGGTVKGITGSSMSVLTMRFKTVGVGSGEISVTKAIVTASDGKGTNVLSKAEGTVVAVGTELSDFDTSPDTSEPQTPSPALVVPAPQKIERVAVEASNLPAGPVLNVPLYPDPLLWYNNIGELTVLWDVPDDIIKVAVELDQNPNTEPSKAEDGLFTGKKFGNLNEGIWYVHVQFKNNVGWGKVTHHRVAIDLTPPLPFEVETDILVSDNPSPVIRFDAKDELSGYSHSFIFIDDNESIKSTSTSLVLPIQEPGDHVVKVQVFDFAGNSIEDDLVFETLPLPTPVIKFITKNVDFEEPVFASGSSVPNGSIDVFLKSITDQKVFRNVGQSDAFGNWEASIVGQLPTGKYDVSFRVTDTRGAISFQTEPQMIKIKPKAAISIGFLELGWFEVFLILVLAVVSGVSFFSWYQLEQKDTRAAYNIIAARDVEKLSDLLFKDLEQLEALHAKQKYKSKALKTEVEYHYGMLRKNIGRIKKYISKEISKLK